MTSISISDLLTIIYVLVDMAVAKSLDKSLFVVLRGAFCPEVTLPSHVRDPSDAENAPSG